MVISVVIVTFNNLAEIGACLDALVTGLTHFESHLYIIDNASSDGTPRWLKANQIVYEKFFTDISLQCNAVNSGFTAAVNQGLKSCKGDLVLILNPDVVVQPDTVTTLAATLHTRPEIGVVVPQLRFLNGDIQASCRRFPRKTDVLVQLTGMARIFAWLRRPDWKMSDFDHRDSRFVEQPQGAFLLTRQTVLDQVGLLDERFFMFFSDVDWCERVHHAGWRIWFCAQTFVYHHKGASIRRERPRMLVTSHRSFVDYFAKKDQTHTDKIGTKIVMFILTMALWPRLLLTLRHSAPS